MILLSTKICARSHPIFPSRSPLPVVLRRIVPGRPCILFQRPQHESLGCDFLRRLRTHLGFLIRCDIMEGIHQVLRDGHATIVRVQDRWCFNSISFGHCRLPHPCHSVSGAWIFGIIGVLYSAQTYPLSTYVHAAHSDRHGPMSVIPTMPPPRMRFGQRVIRSFVVSPIHGSIGRDGI